MALPYDKCPICRRDFRDCSHSIAEVEKRGQQNDLEKLIRRIVREELARRQKEGA